jgi:putative phosphoesterase
MIKTDKEELLIGLIGDTHIPSTGPSIPESIIKEFQGRKIDYLIHVGDFTSIAVYETLQDIFGKEKVIAIAGNMDNLKLAKTLPKKLELESYGHKIFITHGLGGPHNIIKRLNREFDLSEYDIIIFGHVHRPFNEEWSDGKLYFSPGSPTDRRFTDVNSYGYLCISKEKIVPKIIYID